MRQAGGVAEGRPRHAERPRLAGHALAELALGLRQPLGDDCRNVVGRFRDTCEQPSSMLGKAASKVTLKIPFLISFRRLRDIWKFSRGIIPLGSGSKKSILGSSWLFAIGKMPIL